MMSLLTIDNLRISFPTEQGLTEVVKGISFELGRERLGIVGESGSGKSMTGRAILRLIGKPGTVTADRMEFDGIDLAGLSERRMRALRGARISMVMQDPKFSLNPVMRIGDQIGEVLSFHRKMNAAARRKRVMEVLEAVRITDAERVYKLYPHEVSGGMGQRIMIAMMVILEPDLMIADEPTSALDVSVQAQVLDIMDDLVNRTGMGLIIISHDLNMGARYCDRILVMFNGEIVETCAAKDLADAQHPYTQGLLASMPTIDERRTRLPVLDRTLLGGD
jgi:peptide/nickel transport system ATP-binding protein